MGHVETRQNTYSSNFWESAGLPEFRRENILPSEWPEPMCVCGSTQSLRLKNQALGASGLCITHTTSSVFNENTSMISLRVCCYHGARIHAGGELKVLRCPSICQELLHAG